MASKAEAALEIFKKNLGTDEGVGEWHTVDQDQINLFADATLDHQFIHVDPEKSAQLSPYKVTIAHGFLTLSMVVHLQKSIPQSNPKAYEGLIMGVNYGLDRVRFPNPVKVNARPAASTPWTCRQSRPSSAAVIDLIASAIDAPPRRAASPSGP